MKKLRSLWMGILLGVIAIVAMGIVYIDTTQNYWYVNGGFVKLIVSNQTAQASMTVATNTLSIGFNTNNTIFSFVVQGRSPSPVGTATGTSAANSGGIRAVAGSGGNSTNDTTATGGIGGNMVFRAGAGGEATTATTNATGGAGGTLTFQGGTGGGDNSAQPATATNSATGGNGGNVVFNGGIAGSPAATGTSPTNVVGGNGGGITISGAIGGAPQAGWAQKGGNGGAVTITAGNGASGVRTNGGDGANVSIAAGAAGAATTGGNAGASGIVSITGGAGATGNTNSNGGSVFIAGGTPGTGATAGNVVLNVPSGGTARGRTGIRVPNPQESLDVQGSTQLSSNVIYTNLVILAATNSTANTNLTMDFNQAVTSVTLTNNASITNIVNLSDGKSKSILIFITASGGPYNLVWPTLGAANPNFGARFYTNRNSPIFTTVTNKIAVSATSDGTNVQLSMTEWL